MKHSISYHLMFSIYLASCYALRMSGHRKWPSTLSLLNKHSSIPFLTMQQSPIKPKQKTSHNKYTVAIRLRPCFTSSSSEIFSVHQGNKIRELRPNSIVTYCFDQAFQPEHDNAFIFDSSVRQKIEHFVNKGVNTTILAYGQTGSGKTHTLFGHAGKGEENRDRGICEHILEYVVGQAFSRKQEMVCSFVQIYKEKVTDLLSGSQIILRDNKDGELVMTQKTDVKVQSLEQILAVLKKANSNKIFGSSYVHSESSRSHVMFTLQLSSGAILNIVDLCGSEVLTYQFDQKQRQETNAINLSLFTLNAVINDLCSADNRGFLPFRNSVLTRLLKKSLIDQKKTQIYLFCNISPEEKHRNFSVSTLKFGQTAISIDEAVNVVQQKVNLSQQKRDSKKVDNIIDLAPQPKKTQQKLMKWQRFAANFNGNKVILYERRQEKAQANIIFLHAYGYGCDGTDWDNFIPYIVKDVKVNMFSVDLPGFGSSEGQKFTSRAEDFGSKGEPMQFMVELFKILKITPKNKTFLVGYDLGGAIALCSALHTSLRKCLSGISVFHPTWTDKIQKLALITCPVQLIWFPIQNFHLISAGLKMSKAIKSSKLYRLNVGAFTQDKAAGLYYIYSDTVGGVVNQFIKTVAVPELPQGTRGRIEEETIDVGASKQEQQLETKVKAVREFYQMITDKRYAQVFDAIIKGGENKPKYVRLASELPLIEHGTSMQKLIQYGYFPAAPQPLEDNLPLFAAGRQVHAQTTIFMSVLEGEQKYLTYKHGKNGQRGITHRCWVSEQQMEQQILSSGQISVKIETYEGPLKQIKVDLGRTIELNAQTLFRTVNGNTIFEDNVTCKYNSLVTKLMLARCCFAIRQIVPRLNLKLNMPATLKMQKQCARLIYEQMDLRHLVHEGIDNSRYTGTDVGRLAYYGQGNCHHLASVLAALLLPFSGLLGWEVIFRAGSFFMTGREIDEQGKPRPGWDGRPNTRVEDHTWLEIVYKPSFHICVVDPSFGICSQPLELHYSPQGKMHISGKRQCGASTPMYQYIYDAKTRALL